METIIDYLKRNIRAAGPKRWEAIAEAAGVAKSLPRKIVYEWNPPFPPEKKPGGPGVITIQPLINYFFAVDRGELSLPEVAEDERAEA